MNDESLNKEAVGGGIFPDCFGAAFSAAGLMCVCVCVCPHRPPACLTTDNCCLGFNKESFLFGCRSSLKQEPKVTAALTCGGPGGDPAWLEQSC